MGLLLDIIIVLVAVTDDLYCMCRFDTLQHLP